MSLRVPFSPRLHTDYFPIQVESDTTASPTPTPLESEISSGQLFIAALFFLVIPIVAFVLLGGVQKVKKLLGYDSKGKGRSGKYSRLEDLEK